MRNNYVLTIYFNNTQDVVIDIVKSVTEVELKEYIAEIGAEFEQDKVPVYITVFPEKSALQLRDQLNVNYPNDNL